MNFACNTAKGSLLISGLLILALTACQDEPAPSPDETVSQSVPVPALDDAEWPLHGLDVGEQRFSTLNQINRDTVGELELAWSFDMYTRRGVEATPLMVDGTVYVTGSWSMVYALDARSGKLKWFYNPEVDRSFLAKGCCDAVNRGVAYANGRIFLGSYDGRLIALDADTGDVVWDVQTTDRDQPYTITGAPRVVKDKIVIGNGGAELGVRGYVSAYDQQNGELAWRFYTVPGNPADGFENEAMKMAAETWTGEWWEWGGGGTAWDSMVFDPELDLLYIGVGNGSPWNHKLRSPEGGDNLFLSSIVAVKPDTGEYVWHYQTTPGESWDYTATQHMMLADLEIDGRTRKVLMQAPKNGFYYVIDRTNGELISAEPYVDVMTWATHVDPETGRPVETENARVFDGSNISLPSNAGAHNWPPMSYNPNLGLVYIPTMVFPIAFLEPSTDEYKLPGQGMWNTGFDRRANILPPLPTDEVNKIINETYTGQLIAWDPVKQRRVWAQPMGLPNTGGTLATAGGLVFHGGDMTHLQATDAATGEVLWSRDTQTVASAAPATYALDGEQYVVAAVGFGGGFAAEGGPVAHGWKVPNISRVLAYKLGGSHELPARTPTDRELPKPPPVTADEAILEQGMLVYHRHCGVCHGDSLRTGGITPDLRWSGQEVHDIWQDIVLGGVLSARGMVSFADFIDADQAEAVRQYVLSEANRLYREQNPVAE